MTSSWEPRQRTPAASSTRDSFGTHPFRKRRRQSRDKSCRFFSRLNLFTLTPEVNRFGENGSRERGF